MPIKPPSFNSGNQIFDPFQFAPVQKRGIPPEEAFDKMLEVYVHDISVRQGAKYSEDRIAIPPKRMGVSAIPVEDARRMFVDYVSYWEGFYRNVSRFMHEHMNICTSVSPVMMDMRTTDIRGQLSQGYVVHADRRSGKTKALVDEADEMSRLAMCRVAIVSPHKENVLAELCRRRLDHAVPRQFEGFEVIGESEIHKLEGMSSDVLVDDWFDLQERSREMLARGGRVCAVGTIPHGTRIPISLQTQRDEDKFHGRRPDTYNPVVMSRFMKKDSGY